MLVAFFGWSVPMDTVLSFPYAQIGSGLRALSEASPILNLLAIVLLWGVGLSPLVGVVLAWRRKRFHGETLLLVILSLVLVPVLYFMVNPGVLSFIFDRGVVQYPGIDSLLQAMAGVLVDSVILGYVVLRMLRSVRTGGMERLLRYLSGLLVLFAAVLIWTVLGVGFAQLVAGWKSVLPNVTITGGPDIFPPWWWRTNLPFMRSGDSIAMPLCALTVRFVAGYTAAVMAISVLLSAWRLTRAMQVDRYSTRTVSAANALARLAGKALTVIVLVSISFNVLQIVLAKWTDQISINATVPIIELAVVVLALLVARVLAENEQLKQENDMFV